MPVPPQPFSRPVPSPSIPSIPPMSFGFDVLRNILGHGGQMNEESKKNFKKCREQFRDVAKTFMEQVKKNNEAYMKNSEAKTEEKVEEKVE